MGDTDAEDTPAISLWRSGPGFSITFRASFPWDNRFRGEQKCATLDEPTSSPGVHTALVAMTRLAEGDAPETIWIGLARDAQSGEVSVMSSATGVRVHVEER